MDMNMLGEDFRKALDMLPAPFVMSMLNNVMANAPTLATQVPAIIKLMAPHFNAGLMEKTAGLLTMEEIAGTLLPLIQAYVMEHASAG